MAGIDWGEKIEHKGDARPYWLDPKAWVKVQGYACLADDPILDWSIPGKFCLRSDHPYYAQAALQPIMDDTMDASSLNMHGGSFADGVRACIEALPYAGPTNGYQLSYEAEARKAMQALLPPEQPKDRGSELVEAYRAYLNEDAPGSADDMRLREESAFARWLDKEGMLK